MIFCCDHPSPFHVGDRAQWCPFCGALRYTIERGTSLVTLEWFRPSVVEQERVERMHSLSMAASSAVLFVYEQGPTRLADLKERFGQAAILEAVFADRLDVDDQGRAFSKGAPPASSPRLRAAARATR